jgi:hypothetical protein
MFIVLCENTPIGNSILDICRHLSVCLIMTVGLKDRIPSATIQKAMTSPNYRGLYVASHLPEIFVASGRHNRPVSAANERHRRMTGAQTERKHTLRIGRLVFVGGEHVVETIEPSLLQEPLQTGVKLLSQHFAHPCTRTTEHSTP